MEPRTISPATALAIAAFWTLAAVLWWIGCEPGDPSPPTAPVTTEAPAASVAPPETTPPTTAPVTQPPEPVATPSTTSAPPPVEPVPAPPPPVPAPIAPTG